MEHKWNPITEEMLECEGKHKDFPINNMFVWIAYEGCGIQTEIAYISHEYSTRYGKQYGWYGADGVRITSIYDDRVKAWMYLEIPEPYRERGKTNEDLAQALK